MIAIKPGVDIANLTPQMVLAVAVADSHWGSVTITSGREGVHQGHPVAGTDRDPHYLGLAVDLRLPVAPHLSAEAGASALRVALGAQYVVLLEPTHIHVQFGHIAPEPHATA